MMALQHLHIYLHTVWRRDDRGASLVEYALLVALIAVVCIGAITLFGTATGNSLKNSNSLITPN